MTIASPSPASPPEPERRRRRRTLRRGVLVLIAVAALLATACGSADSGDETKGSAVVGPALSQGTLPRFPDGTKVRLVTHDSFAVSEDVLAQFTEQTGIEVEVVAAGDAVAMVNKAILTKGNPEGDVLFGIDENLLTSAFANDLFEPYQAEGLSAVPATYDVDPEHRVTPIDHGDVCINYDRGWFTRQNRPLPTSFADLTAPDLAGKLVVEDPSASTPGLSFMLATIAASGGGDDTSDQAAWLQYWSALKANGVKVDDGWETAYYSDFSGGSGEGDRPLVVSYASSPPAEVANADVAVDETPTGVLTDTCYRQTEFAGVLSGAHNPEAAKALIEFMLGLQFQEDMPLQMYVYPVNDQAQLPEVFEKYTAPVAESLSLPYEEVGANRDRWVQQWSTLFR